ncbi:flavin monooxygenase-like protein [Aspergillus carlsbadensis]|nr:flavin monooxygenase-like protein [Aspergillus carlsbadensis]
MSTVAVIGAGAAGLTTLKNLLEEGFKATAFERDTQVGGIWNFDEGEKPSVLQSTIANNTSDFGCYTDLPYPHDAPTYPSAPEVCQYLKSYAEHFNLLPHVRLGTNIKRARLTTIDGVEKWELVITTDPLDAADASAKEEELLYFDKLVMATGSFSTPSRPDIPGLARFTGRVLHSCAYKRPEKFKSLSVLVVGSGNTAADVVTTLTGHTKQVYWSHRHGVIILPRRINDKPLDHTLTYRTTRIGDTIASYAPGYAARMTERMLQGLQNKAFSIKPEWNLSPAPALKHALPIISDDLVTELEAGRAISVPGMKQVLGERSVEVADGSVLADIDAIIFCTGYEKTDWALVGEELDPTRHTTSRWTAAQGSRGRVLPRLYQNVFSVDRPQSLAYVGVFAGLIAGFTMADLAAMAITQVWKAGSSSSALPSVDEMNRQVDRHHEWLCEIAESGSCAPHALDFKLWAAWAHGTAGTGVDTKLGYGIEGWAFWLRDRVFCNTLMTGIMSPLIFRVFPGARRWAWEGARGAIDRVNRERRGRIIRWHGEVSQ